MRAIGSTAQNNGFEEKIRMKNFIPDGISEFDNVFDVLKERGFIEQTTDEEKIRKLLSEEKIKFYIGFDPTADCLHVGHFMQVIIMMYMQKYGHTPVVLLGGGTGKTYYPRKIITIGITTTNRTVLKVTTLVAVDRKSVV